MKERVTKYLKCLAVEAVTVYSYLFHKEAKPSKLVYIPLILIMVYLAFTDLFKLIWSALMENPDDI